MVICSGKRAEDYDEIKPLIDLCKTGRLFDVQAWIAEGKPINPPPPPAKGARIRQRPGQSHVYYTPTLPRMQQLVHSPTAGAKTRSSLDRSFAFPDPAHSHHSCASTSRTSYRDKRRMC